MQLGTRIRRGDYFEDEEDEREEEEGRVLLAGGVE